MKRSKILVVAGIAGFAIGGYSLAGAGADTSSRTEDAQQAAGVGAFGAEPVDVLLRDGKQTLPVQLAMTDDDKLPYCVTITEADSATTFSCFDKATVASGGAYIMSQNRPGDPISIIGLVGDDVDAIEIDGRTIEPTKNVWFASVSKPTSYIVYTGSRADEITDSARFGLSD